MLARTPQAEIDAGPRSDRAATERMCVATRTVRPIVEMIRYVVAPDGASFPISRTSCRGAGPGSRRPGRRLQQAIRRKAFGAAFKREVRVDPALADLTDRLLERAALDALAICGKASLAVAGFAKVEAALARDRVLAALLHAADAAPDGVRKLDAALRRPKPTQSGCESSPISRRSNWIWHSHAQM